MNPVRLDGSAEAVPVEFDAREEMAKATSENFPVAMRLLPTSVRSHLHAIYGYARFVDDIGDRSSGDRLAELDWAEAELDRALAGRASHPIFVSIGTTARAFDIDRQPFIDLIEANRLDQRVTRYASFEDLVGYCSLSANPVGRLVLAVFGDRDSRKLTLSDDVCTGLQLIEHWQDVAEDCAAGRVYIPTSDLSSFGVDEQELSNSSATPAFRRLIAFECARARRLIESGPPLVSSLRRWGRLAVAGFVGGGLAQLEAIEMRSFDVLSSPAKATKASVGRKTIAVLASASKASR